MKVKTLFLILFLSFFSILSAQSEFITIWRPGMGGSPNNKISFYAQGTNYSISWEEVGNPSHSETLTNVTSTNSLVTLDLGLPSPGAMYILRISNGNGNFNRIRLDGNKSIINIDQWGNSIQWSSMALAFYNCTNLAITAPDIPNVSNVTDFSGMFYNCYVMAGHPSFNNWNMSSAVNLSNMFYNARTFNQPIGNWNTSNVTNMSNMFNQAKLFNQPLGTWNTSNVINMSDMFRQAEVFNQPIGTWDTSKVINMSGLFASAHQFNQPIGNWNVSKVTNMSATFQSTPFNQPIENWDTSNVTDMSSMFGGSFFSQPIGNWDVSDVTNMANMFYGSRFNQPIGNWDVSNVKSMYSMFAYTRFFNQPIGSWNTSSVTDMISMFYDTEAFNQPIGTWNTSNVTSMISMFAKAKLFNQPIGTWNTSNVTDMRSMFTESKVFNQPIGSWDTSKVTNMEYMFDYTDVFNQPIGNWDTSKVEYMGYMFYFAKAFNQSLGNWNLNRVKNLRELFTDSNLSCINYDSTLIGWANNPATNNNVILTSGAKRYSSQAAVNARNFLKNTKGWNITNDYYDPNCNPVLSTSENVKKEFSTYPNPVKHTLFFTDEVSKIEIYSLEGRLLHSDNSTGKHADVSELPKGIYLMKAIDKTGNTVHKKFIKD
ncbi:Por secretion system C-terminal sorting domain-containing protein [Chryseobacterium oleae]|uniref:Por secretion system C-terminal sorting domain-containing protein n=1 Tax=Chryseobacterium oleae TaxID=491207 RepID=A0A1I5A5M5_CHROL|nr:BspA family leucine-rich repeat surface protein [Chryseobacterium oleae]SFN57716.1 Por secretion system C-terminal sorting domain-containing protein [Chryseobacterium oleae]